MATPTTTTDWAIMLLVEGCMALGYANDRRLKALESIRRVKRTVKSGVVMPWHHYQTATARCTDSTIVSMLFMVIEQFRNNDPNPVRERFLRDGRMLPEGVVYHASWVDPVRARCYQLMEAPDLDKVRLWTQSWEDLVEFEIVPVLTSQEFWPRFGG
jgi:Protein of unknown function (DUF3303)